MKRDSCPARGTAATAVILMLVAGWLAATGCSVIKKAASMRMPELTFRSVRVAGLDPGGVDLDFTVDLKNPNPVPVTLESVEYDLFLEGSRFLSGRRDTPQPIRALRTSPLQLPLRLDVADLRRTYRSVANRDSISYELRARLTFQIPVLGYRSLGLKQAGRLPRVLPPGIRLERIQVQRLGLRRARLALRLAIRNPNGFEITVRQGQTSLSVDAVSWAEGQLQEPLVLPAHGSETLALPLSVDLSTLGRKTYVHLLERKPLSYHLTGQLELETPLSFLPSTPIRIDLHGTASLGK